MIRLHIICYCQIRQGFFYDKHGLYYQLKGGGTVRVQENGRGTEDTHKKKDTRRGRMGTVFIGMLGKESE